MLSVRVDGVGSVGVPEHECSCHVRLDPILNVLHHASVCISTVHRVRKVGCRAIQSQNANDRVGIHVLPRLARPDTCVHLISADELLLEKDVGCKTGDLRTITCSCAR